MPSLFDLLLQQLEQQQVPIGILGNYGAPLILSDESPYPVLPGQQYAGPKQPYNPMSGFSPLIPDPNQLVGSMAGSVTGGARIPSAVPKGAPKGRRMTKEEIEVEKAFEQYRKDSIGLTREQRQERAQKAADDEFNRIQEMSDADWMAEMNALRDALNKGR